MAEGIIPVRIDARLSWLDNMILNFPAAGANLGFSAAEIESFVIDCETVRFAIIFARGAKNFSKAANKFKIAVFKGTSGNLSVPEFSEMDGAPAALSGAGALVRIQRAVRRMKAYQKYNQTVGEILRIHTAKPAPLSLGDAKPTAEVEALVNSVTRIDWRKGKFTGVFVESMRGDETEWTSLGQDTRSPFIDARPPLEAGKPEQRRYRLIYFLGDEKVGVWSDTITIITKP